MAMLPNIIRCSVFVLLAGICISAFPVEDSEWVRKTIRFNLTVQNPKATTTDREHLYVYVPPSSANQRVVQTEANIPYEEKTDEFGNRYLIFLFDRLPPLTTRLVTITTTVDIANRAQAVDMPTNQVFSDAEAMVESKHSGIKVLAHSLARESLLETVQETYRWIQNNLTYAGYIADDLGALSAYEKKSGDCSEYAYLLAALNRANGISTKILGGYFLSSNAIVKPSDYHNWNEVYLDGKWLLVDAQKGNFMTPLENYLVTRVVVRNGLSPESIFVHRYHNPEGGLRISID